jgi:gliding motility-associated-like protein
MKKLYILFFFFSYSIFAQVEPQSISPVPVGCKPAIVPPPLPMPANTRKQSKIKGAAGVAAVGVVGAVESIHSAFVNWQSGGFTSFSIGTGSVANGANSQNIRWRQGLNATDKTTGGFSYEELRLSALALGTTFTQGQDFYIHLYNGGADTVVPLNFTWQDLGAAGNVVNVNIETNFGTNGMGGFATWQATDIKDFYDKVIPIIAQVYGPSSHAYTVNVINDGNSAGANMFMNGPNRILTQYTADANRKMTQPRLMVHELIHAWRDNVCLSSSNVWHYDFTLSGFEEGMADCVAEIVMDKFIETYPGYYSGSSNYLSQHWSHEPGYAFDWDYDFQNHSQLTTTNFWSSDQGIGAHWERYGTGSAAFYKMYVEDNNFFKNFNAEYYRRMNADHALTTSRALMVGICKTVIAKVEEEPTDNWVNKQRILDCSVVPGKKVHMLSFQGAAGSRDMGHDNRIHLIETQNNAGGDEWSWDKYSGSTLIERWFHQLNNFPAKLDIVNYTTGAISNTLNFRNNDMGYGGPNQGPCTNPNINGPGACFPTGIDGHGLYTTSADKAITNGSMNDGSWYNGLGLNPDRIIYKIQTTGLYIYNIEFQSGGAVKGKYYRLHGNGFIGKDGMYAGVRNNTDTPVSGKMYVEQKNTVTPIAGQEPAITINNGTLISSRIWASVPETQSQFQGGRSGTQYSKPGKVHAVYVNSDCTKPQKIDFRNIGYGANVSGVQMFLFNVDDFEDIVYTETMPGILCQGFQADFKVENNFPTYLDTDTRVTYKWKNPAGTIVSTTKTYTIAAVTPADAGVYTLEIDSYGCTITRTKTLVVTPSIVLTPTVVTPISVCTNGTINLDVNGTLPTGTTYAWTGPNAYTNATKNPSITNAQAVNTGLYIVTCTVKDCDGITDIVKTAQIQVNVSPILKPIISCGTPTQNSVTFNWASVIGATDYTVSYQVNSNPIQNIGTIGNLLTYTVSSLSALDNVTISIIPVGGTGTCFAVDSKTCQASAIPACTIPVATVVATAIIGCGSSTVALDGTGSTTGVGINYQWATTTGTITSGATTLSPVVSAAGTYNLVVTNTAGGGCSSTPAVVTVTLNSLPAVPTITSVSATCLAAGTSTISNYNVTNTYTFSPAGPTVSGTGLVNGMVFGTPYTVTSNNESCTSVATVPFSNLDMLVTPAVPTITSVSATCLAAGTSTISNYSATNTYAFSPVGPTVSGTGLVNGMVLGTPYTVTSNNGSCTSVATVPFSNLDMLVTPVVPTIASTGATCSTAGTSTIANYSITNMYAFSPTGPIIKGTGMVSGMVFGTSYTVTSNIGSCSSVASLPFSNANMLISPAVPIIAIGKATCLAVGTSTISNYIASNRYVFSPAGPTVNGTGLVSGMVIGTLYTVTSNNGICTSVASSSFSNANILTVPVVNIGQDITLNCVKTSTTLSNSNTSTNGLTYSWSDGINVLGTNAILPNITTSGIYTLTILNTASGCSNNDSLIVSKDVALPIVNAGVTKKITCVSSTVKLDGTGSSTGANFAYSWSGGTVVLGVSSLTPTVSTAGQYVLLVTNSTNGCSASSSVNVTQDVESPEFTISETGVNQYAILPSAGVGPYQYSVNRADSYSDSPIFKIEFSGNYTIYVKDSKGCSTSERKYLEYLGIEFPKFFSPEGNGSNDHWYPTRIEDYPNLEVSIYDRYQRLIAKFKGNNEIGWDGTYQGKQLPSGDYWYVIKTNNVNDKRELVGNMTLFR